MTKVRGFELVSHITDETLLPQRATKNAAGYDLKAAETVGIEPGQIKLVPTGVKAYMQPDEVLHLYDRSSNAKKQGVVLVNSVGIIDADYYNNPDNEGQIFVQFMNIDKEPVVIKAGERIAQGVFNKFLLTDDDAPTAQLREGGFGSTGS